MRELLSAKDPLLQKDLCVAAHAGAHQVSRTVRWLVEHQHVVRRPEDGRYEVVRPAALVLAMFPYQRVMSRSLVGATRTDRSKRDALRLLVKEGAIPCLETALEAYSQYFRADRVAVYHPAPRKLLARLTPNEGGLLPVEVYSIDIPLEGDVEGPDASGPFRRTGRFRTLVDLTCDNRTYAAKDLFHALWGVHIE